MPEPTSAPDKTTVGVEIAPAMALERTGVPVPGVDETLSLLAEELSVGKRELLAGTVRVATRTETHEEIAEISLAQTVAEVTRVPVGRIVEVVPAVRTEGDTTIVPIVEERFVIVKQLFLKEELHLTTRTETELSRMPIQLRRQTATIERLDASGATVAEDQST